MSSLFCGIDLGTRASSICVVDSSKKVIKRWTGKNEEISEVVRKLCSDIHCVVEASPLAESVCRLIEAIGGTIEIIDSRHAKALLNGKKKTDRIDAQVLAELAQMGWYKPIHRKEGKCREQRSFLVARAQIVKSATSLKNTIRGMFKANGVVLPKGGDGRVFVKIVRDAMKMLPVLVQSSVTQLLICWIQLHRSETRMYRALDKIAHQDATASLLMTVPGVGAATAVGFASTIATHTRFSHKKKVASYLGLAPKVYQSGDTNYHGHITKKGDSLLRWLLTEAASAILTRIKEPFALREWGLRLVEQKGLAKAKIAVARKLSELLFTMWRSNKAFATA
jgi:transposase